MWPSQGGGGGHSAQENIRMEHDLQMESRGDTLLTGASSPVATDISQYDGHTRDTSVELLELDEPRMEITAPTGWVATKPPSSPEKSFTSPDQFIDTPLPNSGDSPVSSQWGSPVGDTVTVTAPAPAVSFLSQASLSKTIKKRRQQASSPGATAPKERLTDGLPCGPPREWTINIASFNVKNVATNLNFVKHLSKTSSVLFLQETWLYNYQKNLLSQVYDNTKFVAGCVDDCNPVGPSLHARGYGGTCILWARSHNASIRVLPESNERINVVEYNQECVLLCLVNVYLPTRGAADHEEAFGECMDMLHEIILKYNSSHAVIIGGDFNSSMHRGTSLRRDRLLMEFVSEHHLNVEVDCPVGDTFFHASNDSSSQIDYFLVAGSPS